MLTHLSLSAGGASGAAHGEGCGPKREALAHSADDTVVHLCCTAHTHTAQASTGRPSLVILPDSGHTVVASVAVLFHPGLSGNAIVELQVLNGILAVSCVSWLWVWRTF